MATLVGVRLSGSRMAGDTDATVGLVLDLPEPEALIGRLPSSGANVVLDSAAVARWHARIRRAGGEHTIEDPGSRNGTFVNGSRLSPHVPVALADGDEVRFAHLLTFVFRAGLSRE